MEQRDQPRPTRASPRRWIVGLAAIGVLPLIASMIVVAYNTLAFTSKQIRGAAPVAASRPRPGFAERLGRAIQFRTIAAGSSDEADGAAFDGLRDFLAASFPGVHERLDREVFGGRSLLFRWKGTDPSTRPILLMSHLDVVPVQRGTEGDWAYPPFSGAVADGHIWGRGTLDVKCGAVGLLEAVELLLADGFRPGCDVYIALGHDEETGGLEGNRRIAEALRVRGVRFRFVLDEGGGLTEGIIDGIDAPVAFVGIAEKGYATMGLEATGGGHASMPPRRTAIGRLSAAIARLENDPFPARLDGATGALLDHLGPEMPWPRRVALANRWLTGRLIARQFAASPALNALMRTTAAATVIRGGEAENALAARASATVNVRLRPGDPSGLARARLLEVVDDEEVRCTRWDVLSEASAVSSTGSVAFRSLHRTIAAVHPGAVVSPGLSMVATDSRHYAAIADDIYRFLPLRVTSRDLERIHGTDERIAVEDYAALIGFLAELIRDTAATPADGPRPGPT
jgi:carboxypeptidase PM20D1